MYELIRLADNTYYIESPAKIGIVKTSDTEVCLIDSGNDKDAGRKIKKILDQNGWHLKAIYNTHSNADHIGGNAYLQRQTNCRIYAPGIECAFTQYPILESSFLYGGYPFKDLRHKFLMAEKSNAELLTPYAVSEGLEIIPLHGHFFDMVGFRTKDNIVFLADCIASKAALDKYKIWFVYDVAAFLGTLETVKQMKADYFVPSHSEVTDDIHPLIEYNIKQVYEIADKIISICKVPHSFEQILSCIFTDYQLIMTYEQNVLVGSTIRSYLSWLKDTGKLDSYFEDNILYYNHSN